MRTRQLSRVNCSAPTVKDGAQPTTAPPPTTTTTPPPKTEALTRTWIYSMIFQQQQPRQYKAQYEQRHMGFAFSFTLARLIHSHETVQVRAPPVLSQTVTPM